MRKSNVSLVNAEKDTKRFWYSCNISNFTFQIALEQLNVEHELFWHYVLSQSIPD